MNESGLTAVSKWLGQTALSAQLQRALWVIPTIQTVHILAIAIAIASAFLLDLRIIGVFATNERSGRIASRVVPWAWGAVVVLAVSGSLLIVAEPERCLPNAAFWVKMAMLAFALATMCVLHGGIRRNSGFWECTPNRRATGRIIAAASLFLWSGVVLAGRWIAYLGLPK